MSFSYLIFANHVLKHHCPASATGFIWIDRILSYQKELQATSRNLHLLRSSSPYLRIKLANQTPISPNRDLPSFSSRTTPHSSLTHSKLSNRPRNHKNPHKDDIKRSIHAQLRGKKPHPDPFIPGTHPPPMMYAQSGLLSPTQRHIRFSIPIPIHPKPARPDLF